MPAILQTQPAGRRRRGRKARSRRRTHASGRLWRGERLCFNRGDVIAAAPPPPATPLPPRRAVGRHASPGIARAARAARGLPRRARPRRRRSRPRPRAATPLAGYRDRAAGGAGQRAPTSRSCSAATARCSSIARRLAPFDVPLIGINQGRLGFLTDIPIARHGRRRSTRCSPAATSRSAARCSPPRSCAPTATREAALALNDVVVNRGGGGTMIECAVEIDGRFVYAMRADGDHRRHADRFDRVRAVGRRADPRSAACPPSRSCRSRRTRSRTGRSRSPTRRRSRSRSSAARDAALHCDGQAHFALAEGDRVTVRRAPHAARFLHPGGPRLLRDAAREAALERDARTPARATRQRRRRHAAAPVDPQLRRRRRARPRVRRAASRC